MNLSDPNSMCDQGITRNAEYKSSIAWGQEPEGKPYEAFLRRDGATNNTFYSFGGSKRLRDATRDKSSMVNPVLRQRGRCQSVIQKDPLEKVQDYTKNISESIFSPGVLPQQERFLATHAKIAMHREAQRPVRRTIQQCDKRRTASATVSVRSKLSGLAAKINQESERKRVLKDEITQVKA